MWLWPSRVIAVGIATTKQSTVVFAVNVASGGPVRPRSAVGFRAWGVVEGQTISPASNSTTQSPLLILQTPNCIKMTDCC